MNLKKWGWILGIAVTLILVMSVSAWMAQQYRNTQFQLELGNIHNNSLQYIHQAQTKIKRKAELVAEMLSVNSQIRKLILQATQPEQDDLKEIRAALQLELLHHWQALESYGASQLNVYLGPDVHKVLRAQSSEIQTVRQAEISALVSKVLEQGHKHAAMEMGQYGAGMRAAVPVKNSADKTVAVIEVGLDIDSGIRPEPEPLLPDEANSSGLSILLPKELAAVLNPVLKRQHILFPEPGWLVKSQSPEHVIDWLLKGMIPSGASEPMQLKLEYGQQQYLVSLQPWTVFAQSRSENPQLLLLSWQDISDIHYSFTWQNQQIWMLWLLAMLVSVALVVFFALRLQKATAQEMRDQQRKLLWSEKKLKALYTLSPLPILLNRLADGTFIEANPAMEELTGYNLDEIKSLSYWDLTPHIYADDEQRQLESLKSTGRYGPYRKQYRHKDGHLIDIELNGMLFEQPDGELMIWSIIQDLSERNRLEKLKSEFIATVSHELRTPLTSIAGSLSLLLSGAAGEQSSASGKLLDIAQRNCKRLTALVNDLLDLEKLSGGKLDFQPQELQVSELIQEAREVNEAYAQEHNVSLTVAKIDDMTVNADPQRSQQLLANLISNAAKFSPAGSKIRMEAERRQDFVRISVVDQGPGLTAEEVSRLFQRFSQLQSPDTKQTSGSGLGLAICREIIEKSGGNIGVDSEPGKGSCFWFELPLAQDRDSAQNQTKGKILIVEDDADIAYTLRSIMSEQGFASDLASNLSEAWQLVSTNNYRLVTLDLRLQNEHGSHFFLKLRDNVATRHVPVLVISAYLEEGKLQLSTIANAIDWIEKPFEPKKVIEKIEQLLNAKTWLIKPNILHVEDDADIVEIVRVQLGRQCDYTSAGSLKEAEAHLQNASFDLILLDIGLPDGSGWELLSKLKSTQGNIPVVVFSAQEHSVIQSGKVSAVYAKSQMETSDLVEQLKSLLEYS